MSLIIDFNIWQIKDIGISRKFSCWTLLFSNNLQSCSYKLIHVKNCDVGRVFGKLQMNLDTTNFFLSFFLNKMISLSSFLKRLRPNTSWSHRKWALVLEISSFNGFSATIFWFLFSLHDFNFPILNYGAGSKVWHTQLTSLSVVSLRRSINIQSTPLNGFGSFLTISFCINFPLIFHNRIKLI